MTKHLVMYCRDAFCPDQARARHLLKEWGVPFQEINISRDSQAAARLQEWNKHLGVPTLVVADTSGVEPITLPAPLSPGQRTRNLDRDSLICEPSEAGLRDFLRRHGLLLE